jgi:hypothetical protein
MIWRQKRVTKTLCKIQNAKGRATKAPKGDANTCAETLISGSTLGSQEKYSADKTEHYTTDKIHRPPVPLNLLREQRHLNWAGNSILADVIHGSKQLKHCFDIRTFSQC